MSIGLALIHVTHEQDANILAIAHLFSRFLPLVIRTLGVLDRIDINKLLLLLKYELKMVAENYQIQHCWATTTTTTAIN